VGLRHPRSAFLHPEKCRKKLNRVELYFNFSNYIFCR
jgi:hypothetical protein